jgi:hypothetical protein
VKRRRLVSWAKRLRLAMIMALALVAILHGVGFGHGVHESVSPLARMDLWVAFATVSLPAWAAALHVILGLDHHEQLAERSSLMAPLLRGLAERVACASSLAHLCECVADAERIMDLESREWAGSLVGQRPEFTG